MHRSNNVRSARNVWSIPTGEHEVGETVMNCMNRELHEEYGLCLLTSEILFQYENIAGDADAEEQYHWILSVYLVLVGDVTQAINKEPDKHDQMLFPSIDLLVEDTFLENYRFHDSLQVQFERLRFNLYDILDQR